MNSFFDLGLAVTYRGAPVSWMIFLLLALCAESRFSKTLLRLGLITSEKSVLVMMAFFYTKRISSSKMLLDFGKFNPITKLQASSFSPSPKRKYTFVVHRNSDEPLIEAYLINVI
jgi:hypothetical protein